MLDVASFSQDLGDHIGEQHLFERRASVSNNASADNTLARPRNVAPATRPGPAWAEGGTVLRLDVPRLSFVVVEAGLATTGG